MSFTYIVLGAGRQGTAAAYDLARYGDGKQIIVADPNPEAAPRAAARVNNLLGRSVLEPASVNAKDARQLEALLRGTSALVSAVPYTLNLEVTRAAVRAGVHVCDLGGHTEIARRQHQLDREARQAGRGKSSTHCSSRR